MTDLAPSDPFPCPFCRSTRVVFTGGGQTFLHYRCQDCSEVWTSMADHARRNRRAAPDGYAAPVGTAFAPVSRSRCILRLAVLFDVIDAVSRDGQSSRCRRGGNFF